MSALERLVRRHTERKRALAPFMAWLEDAARESVDRTEHACPGKHDVLLDNVANHRNPERPRALKHVETAIVDDAIGNSPEREPDVRSLAAVALGAKGASKGGRGRAAKLTPQQRSEIARKAAVERWSRLD